MKQFYQYKAHRSHVLALYRYFVRSAPDLAKPLVRREFRSKKNDMSAHRCTEYLKLATQVSEKLGKSKAPAAFDEIVAEYETAEKAIAQKYRNRILSVKAANMNLKHNLEPNTKKVRRNAEKQRAASLLKLHLVKKQRKHVPRCPDIEAPEYKSAVQKVLFQKALQRYNAVKYLLTVKGPYKVKVDLKVIQSHFMIPFIRTPWQYEKKDMSLLHKSIATYSKLIDTRNIPQDPMYQYGVMEGKWEHLVAQADPNFTNARLSESQFVQPWIQHFIDKRDSYIKKLVRYRRKSEDTIERLPQITQQLQNQADESHRVKLARFEAMSQFIRENNIKLGSEPSLEEVLKKYDFWYK